ncbi:hypothetical protein NDU88_002351 [Pleurodeles waltl]|uniref:Uncharacterized protein n=1 Tax=Pleurodeles waltl TaxID=8319 RepID=A0AAV7NG89_PLEWA|nr:hypothetical protein NDU88_002351 [Pleurodeles waltl]
MCSQPALHMEMLWRRNEKDDGLCARRAKEEKNADNEEEEGEDAKDGSRNGNSVVPLKINAQPWEKKRAETRELRHVPGGMWLTKVVTSPATIQTPGSHRQCPGGTHQSDDHPEENPNPDIWVGSKSPGPEKEKTEAEEAREMREQSEERSANRNERSTKEDDRGPEKEKTEAEEAREMREQSEERSANRNERSKKEDDRGEERSKDLGGETPTRTRPLDGRTHHVPGGAWLSQVRSCRRLSYGSERGIAAEGPEERAQESE